MKFDKLQALLAKLSDEELADFEVSPWSSYTTSRPQVRALFGFLKQQRGNTLTDDEISVGTGIETNRLNDLSNKLLNVLEQYFASKEANKVVQGIEQDLQLLGFYSGLRLWKNYLFIEKRLEKRLSNNEALYPQDFLLLYKYYTEVKVNEKYRIGRKDQGGFELITYYLGALYVYESLKYKIEYLFRKKVVGTYDEQYKAEIKTTATLVDRYQSIPTIRLMALILNCIERNYDDLEENYGDIKMIFLKISNLQLSINLETKNIAEFMLNLCVHGVNQGIDFFSREYMLLIDFLIQHNLILDNGELLVSYYKNAIAMARKAGDYEWAKKFIETQSAFVFPEKNRTILRQFYQSLIALDLNDPNTAYLAFPADNYHLIDDTYFSLSLKKLWIQILIELNRKGEAEPQARALKGFVSKAKINQVHIQKYTAFSNNVLKLCRNTKRYNITDKSLDAADRNWFKKIVRDKYAVAATLVPENGLVENSL